MHNDLNMKRLHLLASVILLLVLSSFHYSNSGNSHTISITINKLRNNNGQIKFLIFKDQDSFANEKPYKVYYVSKKNMMKGKLSCSIKGLTSGTYGISLVDDENNNKEMDYGLLLPTEGFGFSDYYHTGLSRPVFDDFKFSLNGDKRVSMTVRYM